MEADYSFVATLFLFFCGYHVQGSLFYSWAAHLERKKKCTENRHFHDVSRPGNQNFKKCMIFPSCPWLWEPCYTNLNERSWLSTRLLIDSIKIYCSSSEYNFDSSLIERMNKKPSVDSYMLTMEVCKEELTNWHK